MDINQEPKYDAINGQIVNRSTSISIPGNEPIFIIRAKDLLALPTLMQYAALCEQGSVHHQVVMSRIKAFQDFASQNMYQMHMPDSDLSALI